MGKNLIKANLIPGRWYQVTISGQTYSARHRNFIPSRDRKERSFLILILRAEKTASRYDPSTYQVIIQDLESKKSEVGTLLYSFLLYVTSLRNVTKKILAAQRVAEEKNFQEEVAQKEKPATIAN